jgi:hypothetical protein
VLKPNIFGALNVAAEPATQRDYLAEAATHKNYLSDRKTNNSRADFSNVSWQENTLRRAPTPHAGSSALIMTRLFFVLQKRTD